MQIFAHFFQGTAWLALSEAEAAGSDALPLVTAGLMAGAAGMVAWSFLRTKSLLGKQAIELGRREDHLRSVLDQGSELICRYLPDTSLTYVNAAYCLAFRRDEEDLLGRRWLEIVPKTFHSEVSAALRKLRPTRPSITTEHEMVAHSGDPRWERWTHHAIFDGSGKVIEYQSFGWDISSRKLVEQRMVAAEGRLEDIIKAAGEYIWEVDLDGHWISLSDQAEEVLGLPVPKLLGKGPHDFMAEPAASGMQQWIVEQQRLRRSFRNMEYPHRRPDGAVRWVRISGEPVFGPSDALVGFRGTGLDITEERNSIHALRESQQQLDLAISAAALGIWDYDVSNQRLVWNRRWAEILGVPRASHVPSLETWFERIHPEDRPEVNERFQQHLRGEHAIFEAEYRLQAGDGRWIWVLDRGTVVERTVTGESLRAIGMVQDMTQRRQAEAELRAAKEAADRANKAKSEFLANMSHEIRTPMTAVLGYMDILTEEWDRCDEELDETAAKQRDAALSIQSNGLHLLQLINDILDLSKIEAEKFDIEWAPTSPVSICDDIYSMMLVRARDKNITLELAPEWPLPEAFQSDPTRLRQVLVNLIGNAIKFTEEGTVRLVLSFEDGPSPRMIFDIHDTGIGIDAGQIDSLFQPFSQADNSMSRKFGGTGLGLVISRRLAQMLGGDIEVQSRLGVGSRFRLILAARNPGGVRLLDAPTTCPLPRPALTTGPATPAATDSQTAAPGATRPSSVETPAPAAPSSSKAPEGIDGRILLAEDGADNQRLISYFLRKAGAEVEIAENGAIAMQMLLAKRDAGEPFDMVLMDMQMPELDGYGATSQLREMGITTPIVALTAHAMNGDRERCISAGCDDYATKPINRPKLVQTCCDWIAKGRARVREAS